MASTLHGRVFLRATHFNNLSAEDQDTIREYEQHLIAHKDTVFGPHHANLVKTLLSVRGKGLLEDAITWLKAKESPPSSTNPQVATLAEATEVQAGTNTQTEATNENEVVPTPPTSSSAVTNPDTVSEVITTANPERVTKAKKIIEGLVLHGFITPYKEQEKHFIPSTTLKDTYRDNELYLPLHQDITEIKTVTVHQLREAAVYAAYIKRKAGFLAPLTPGKDVYLLTTAENVYLFESDVSREPIVEFVGVHTFLSFDSSHFTYGIKIWSETTTELLSAQTKQEQEALISQLINAGVHFQEVSTLDIEKIPSIYSLKDVDIYGNDVQFNAYKGKVILVVNVSSQCGLTPKNYPELVALDDKYRDEGLVVLGFPSNQFGSQEPGSHAEILEFVKQYNVHFPLFEKRDVNGANARPLFVYLKTKLPGTFGNYIKWNFTKFLIDRNGHPYKRYAPTDNPLSFENDIVELLNKEAEPEVEKSDIVAEEIHAEKQLNTEITAGETTPDLKTSEVEGNVVQHPVVAP